MKIKDISAQEILDSRGTPTIKAKVVLESGAIGISAVPSGASTGSHEAIELRDGGDRFFGLGVQNAIKNIEKINKKFIDRNFETAQEVDSALIYLDGTSNKSVLGANATLAISMAVHRAVAVQENLPLYEFLRHTYKIEDKTYLLPTPMLNIINGGKHADSGLDVQEFMIVPSQATSFKTALQSAVETYHTLKNLLKEKGFSISVGDEGGFAPKIKKHQEVLSLLVEASKKAGYPKMNIALDCASSEFYKEGFYYFEGQRYTFKEIAEIYELWCNKYPIVSIEDPMQEDDWTAWHYFTKILGSKINIVGDDLFVTNLARLKDGLINESANSILIKPNQIGTIKETMEVIALAKRTGYSTIISHRSGETEDTFIADLAVATNAGAIKTGAPARSERTSKYNRLLEIESELGKKAKYSGLYAFESKVRK